MPKLNVEAFLADAQAADAVNELWVANLIPDDLAALAWLLISAAPARSEDC